MTLLASGPRHPTEIASQLNVSKPTVSYHLRELTKRGIVVIADVKPVRGSVYSKTVKLTETGLVAAGTDPHETDLSRPLENLERLKMNWSSLTVPSRADEVKQLVYQLFIARHAASPAMKSTRFREFGRALGLSLLAEEVGEGSLTRILGRLVRLLEREGMANCSLEVLDRPDAVGFHCLSCFDSRDYGGPVCSFTEGILAGVVARKRGKRFIVVRRGDLRTGCHFAIRRNRLKDA